MKINGSGRRIAKIQIVMRFVALAAALAGELWLGLSLVAGVGQTTAHQTEAPLVPNLSLSDVMAAAR